MIIDAPRYDSTDNKTEDVAMKLTRKNKEEVINAVNAMMM